MKRSFLYFAVCILFVASAVLAQSSGAKVHGYVKYKDGTPEWHAIVAYTNTASSRVYKFSTDKNGTYAGIGVTPGTYKVDVISSMGEKLGSRDSVILNAGDDIAVNFDVPFNK